MAASTLPRRHKISRRWLVGGIVFVVVVILVAIVLGGHGQRPSAAAPATTVVTRGDLVGTVSGTGAVAAEQSLNLAFQAAGNVTEILVKDGDAVQAGQALAKLDDHDLQLQLTAAQSNLDSAKARLTQAQQGNARPEDLAVARAQLAVAQANYDKTTRGGTAADVAAAQAAVRSAHASYDAAKNSAGTVSAQLRSATATMEKARVALEQAQGAYNLVSNQPNIGTLPQSRQLQQATIDYQLAEANYESLQQTSDSDAQSKVEAAAAQLEQAKANLAKLTPSTEDVAIAQANLEQAKANLAKLTSAATATDLQVQQAAVTQAEQAFRQAQLNLDNATLKSPFAGLVSDIVIVPGSIVANGTPVLKLINRTPLHVDLKLSENDVAQVQLDMPVGLTIQSLDNWQTNGKVSYIAPAADSTNGVVTYAVRVSFADNDLHVKVGMTADLCIETARKSNVLLVPNTTLLPKGSGHVVQIPTTDARGQFVAREIDVQTGLSDGIQTEIVSGLSEGQQIIALPDTGMKQQSSNMWGPPQ